MNKRREINQTDINGNDNGYIVYNTSSYLLHNRGNGFYYYYAFANREWLGLFNWYVDLIYHIR